MKQDKFDFNYLFLTHGSTVINNKRDMYSLIVVDDEIELLEGVSRLFPWEKLGFQVVGAFENSKSVLDFLSGNDVDAILTDIKLPFTNGLDLIKQIKDSGKEPLFCIMSAYSDFSYAKTALLLGVEDYLVKPFDFADIEETFTRIKTKLDNKHDKRIFDISVSDNPTINKALSLIEEKISTCTLQSIADDLQINESYLSRLFKEKTGSNFQKYLLERKIETAKIMLESTADYKNKEIAAALGYNDVQNFCRVFRKITGMTPQMYRKEHMESGR